MDGFGFILEKNIEIWWILAYLGKFIVIWIKFGGFWGMLVGFDKL